MNTERNDLIENEQVEELEAPVATVEEVAPAEPQPVDKKKLLRRILDHPMRRRYYNIIAGTLATVFAVALFFAVIPFVNGNYAEVKDLWFDAYVEYDRYKDLKEDYYREYARAIVNDDYYRKADMEEKLSDAIYYETFYEYGANTCWSDMKRMERIAIILGCVSIAAAFGSIITLKVGKNKGY